MVDNIAITQGSGTTISTDDIGGVQVQNIKVTYGIDGNMTRVTPTNGLPIQSTDVGNVADVAYTGSGSGSMIALLKKLVAQFTAGFTMSGSVSMADNEGVKGQFGGITANPSQTFTRLANATAYTAGAMVSNNLTAGSVAYGAISAARVAAGGFQIDRCRLTTNTTTGLSGVNFRARLWNALPIYSSGDNAAYAVGTGAAGYLGSYTGVFEQFNDGATAIMVPDVGSPSVRLASGQAVFWDLQTIQAWTPQASKTFTLILESKQD